MMCPILPPHRQHASRPTRSHARYQFFFFTRTPRPKSYTLSLHDALPISAVYAASEGLSVLVLDCRAFGGQAGASARIENYLGFPTGITGMALMARAYSQAQKFGVEMAIPDEATGLELLGGPEHGRCVLKLFDDER